MNVYATESVRAALLDRFPRLAGNPAYWRMLAYLLSGGQRDETTGETVVSAAMLAEFNDAERQHKAGNFRAKKFLLAFTTDILPEFTFSDTWSYVLGKARVVTNSGIPADIQSLWNAAMSGAALGTSSPVDLVSGLHWNRRTGAEETRLDRATASASLRLVGVANETRRVIEYHNALSPHAFTGTVNRHIAEAEAAAQTLSDTVVRAQTLSALSDIKRHAMPLLRAVRNSPRAYSVRPRSLLTVKSEVRKVLTQEWVDYDLKSAQLAIVAKRWRIPDVEQLLASGASVWAHLSAELGLQPSHKRWLKKALYSVVFGMSNKRIAAIFDEKTGIAGVGKRFLALELVRSVRRARDKEVAFLRKTAFEGFTALGKRVPIPSGVSSAERAKAARGFLAEDAQSVELLLLMPVYRLAKQTDQFKVMLYQFDGFTVKYEDKRSAAHWHRRIVQAVQEEVDHQGVITSLESESGAAFPHGKL